VFETTHTTSTPVVASAPVCAGLNIRAKKLYPIFLCTALALAHQLAEAFEWKLVTIHEREYLSAEQVAEFYQLGQKTSIGPTRLLTDGKREIQITADHQTIAINGVKHWLSFPVLEHDGLAMVSRVDLSRTIEPLLRPSSIKSCKTFDTVVLDPGHGGMDNGAQSRWTPDEKTLSLDVAQRSKPLLEAAGFKVVMTRNRDVFVPLEERARIATLIPNSVMVSIHFNSGDRSALGVESYALSPRGTPSSSSRRLSYTDYEQLPGHATDSNNILLASSLQRRMAMARGADNENRGVKRARFVVLKDSGSPSALIECGFVSNSQDAKKISTTAFRQSLATAIRDGVLDYRAQLSGAPESATIFAMAARKDSENPVIPLDHEAIAKPIVDTTPPIFKRRVDLLPPVHLPAEAKISSPADTNKTHPAPAPFRPDY